MMTVTCLQQCVDLEFSLECLHRTKEGSEVCAVRLMIEPGGQADTRVQPNLLALTVCLEAVCS